MHFHIRASEQVVSADRKEFIGGIWASNIDHCEKDAITV